MVERSRRAKGKKALLGSHQRSWLWGRHLVVETLSAGRWPIVELLLAEDLPPDELQTARQLAVRHEVKIRLEPRAVLQRLCHSSEHQGYLSKMAPFPYADAAAVLARQAAAPLYVLLDEIQDPHNFGALLRSAEVFAVDAVFISAKRQVPVNSLVARSSAGAVNRVPIVQADDLCQIAEMLHGLGMRVVGGSEKAEQELGLFNFRQPTALVLGNEGGGISPAMLARCDSLIRIPQAGTIGSLNVAAAAAVIFYEAQRQRNSQ